MTTDHPFRCGVLIPAYQPDEKLTGLVERLVGETGLAPVVVDDGSTRGREIFPQVEALGATVLTHPQNRGKGRALKTGIAWMAQAGFDGVVTADADGQHLVEDIVAIARTLEQHPDQLVLGVRELSQMPLKSRMGNTMTRWLFQLLYGTQVTDTQTGLRGMALGGGQAQRLLALYGERYELEMEMLIHAPRLFSGITEVPIQTVYLDNNASTHFHPLRDGAKIYARLLRSFPLFLLSSLLSFALDYGLFNALYYLARLGAGPATVVARLFSAMENYLFNRHIVFRGRGKGYSLKNYVLLAAAVLAVNVALIQLLVGGLHLPAYLAKLLVECCLYVVNFFVQSHLASREK